MIVNLLYLIFTLSYFSTVISYTYDVEDNCDCEIKWYFSYIRYFSIAYIVMTIIAFLYAIMLVMSYNSTHIWHNNFARYIILMLILVKSVGMIVYFYCFYSFQNHIVNNKDNCGCYRGKFYDVVGIMTHVYVGLFALGVIKLLSNMIAKRKIKNDGQ